METVNIVRDRSDVADVHSRARGVPFTGSCGVFVAMEATGIVAIASLACTAASIATSAC